MSNKVNTDILERAQICLDYFENHPSRVQESLIQAIHSGNLEDVQYHTARCEAQMQKDFFEFGDIY